jgi:hypothetical protein
MSDWTKEEAAAFVARYGVAWMTPELLEDLRACADRVTATANAVPRMKSEYDEPAHVFAGPR